MIITVQLELILLRSTLTCSKCLVVLHPSVFISWCRPSLSPITYPRSFDYSIEWFGCLAIDCFTATGTGR